MFFPLMTELSKAKMLIAGGGSVAYRKACLFIKFGVDITVVSPKFCEFFNDTDLPFTKIEKEYSDEMLEHIDIVIAATDNEETNKKISADCFGRHIPVNVVDTPELCSFYVPAVACSGDLVIGISTGGKSPALASQIRKKMEAEYGDYSEKVSLLGTLRTIVKENVTDIKERKKILSAAAEMSAEEINEYISRFQNKEGGYL